MTRNNQCSIDRFEFGTRLFLNSQTSHRPLAEINKAHNSWTVRNKRILPKLARQRTREVINLVDTKWLTSAIPPYVCSYSHSAKVCTVNFIQIRVCGKTELDGCVCAKIRVSSRKSSGQCTLLCVYVVYVYGTGTGPTRRGIVMD